MCKNYDYQQHILFFYSFYSSLYTQHDIHNSYDGGAHILNIRSKATNVPHNPATSAVHTPTDFTNTVILSFMARPSGLCGSSDKTKQGTWVTLLFTSVSVNSIRFVSLSKSISLAQWSQLLLDLPSLLVICMSTFFNGIGHEQNRNARISIVLLMYSDMP